MMSNAKFNAKIYPWYVEFSGYAFYVVDDTRTFNRSRIIAGPMDRDAAELIASAPKLKEENDQLRRNKMVKRKVSSWILADFSDQERDKYKSGEMSPNQHDYIQSLIKRIKTEFLETELHELKFEKEDEQIRMMDEKKQFIQRQNVRYIKKENKKLRDLFQWLLESHEIYEENFITGADVEKEFKQPLRELGFRLPWEVNGEH